MDQLCFGRSGVHVLKLSALKIHISLEMKKALDAIGGFRTECRGMVDVKVGTFYIVLVPSILYVIFAG